MEKSQMLMMNTDELYKKGWPRDVVELWIKDRQFCIIEFTQEQFDVILAKGLKDAKRHLHFCQQGDMWYAGVAPEILQDIMMLSPSENVAEAVTFAATHSIGEMILLKFMRRP